jgi:hypothetical protein
MSRYRHSDDTWMTLPAQPKATRLTSRADTSAGAVGYFGSPAENMTGLALSGGSGVKRSASVVDGPNRSISAFTFTEAEVTVSPEVWARIREVSREVGRIIHDEAIPADTPDGIRISSTLALFEVAKPDTTSRA